MKHLTTLSLSAALLLIAPASSAVEVFGLADTFSYGESADGTANLSYPGVATFTADTVVNEGTAVEVSDSQTAATSVQSSSIWTSGPSEADAFGDTIFSPIFDVWPQAAVGLQESGSGEATTSTVQDVIVSGTGNVTILYGIKVLTKITDGIDANTQVTATITVSDSIGQTDSATTMSIGPGTTSSSVPATVNLMYVATPAPTTSTITIDAVVTADTGITPIVAPRALPTVGLLPGLLLIAGLSGLGLPQARLARRS